MAKPAAGSPDAPLASTLPRGGAWESQVQFGGLRMDQTFQENEAFIIWSLKAGPEINTELGPAKKSLLQVSRIDDPDTKFEVGTLSEPIAKMAELALATDFPVEAFWKKVEGSQGSPATVLEAVRPWEDPAND